MGQLFLVLKLIIQFCQKKLTIYNMDKAIGKILIVDDNTSVLNSIKLFLQFEFEEVRGINNPKYIPGLLKSGEFDVVLLDMNFTAGVSSGTEGIYWLKKILKYDPSVMVVLITAYGDVELAVRAIKEGATDFILKPWENEKLISTLKTALKLRQSGKKLKILEQKQKQLSEEIGRKYSDFIGNSISIQELKSTIKKVAITDANILITGENGTGKELIAREIHRQSKRSNEVFITVDINTISETLFESELFGHKKGAFTDANTDRTGRFEIASGGTLFLDEIGNLSLVSQIKLLRVLESREIVPVGSNMNIDVDIRLICATNKNIGKLIKEGLFRQDLLYRINTIHIEAPSLKERGEDIILLANYFLEQYSEKYEKGNLLINNMAIDKLQSYFWPGNVRELKHAIEKAVILCESKVLKAHDFLLNSFEDRAYYKNKKLTLEESEKITISKALTNNDGNLSETAKELNIARQTLYNKIEKYRIGY